MSDKQELVVCRTPQGVRGLKWNHRSDEKEITGRTPQGVRGLKLKSGKEARVLQGSRTPQGVRGLKSLILSSPF